MAHPANANGPSLHAFGSNQALHPPAAPAVTRPCHEPPVTLKMGAWLTIMRNGPAALLRWITIAVGIFCFIVLLAVFHFADTDLWAKLAIGAHFWKYGAVPQHDLFAFTPVLPRYIEHEWGAGVIFFGVLKFFGPTGLLWLKIVLALGALATALTGARKQGVDWNVLMLLAIPAAVCLLPGYVPVLRSHAFTYFFFALTLFGLESRRLCRFRTAAA